MPTLGTEYTHSICLNYIIVRLRSRASLCSTPNWLNAQHTLNEAATVVEKLWVGRILWLNEAGRNLQFNCTAYYQVWIKLILWLPFFCSPSVCTYVIRSTIDLFYYGTPLFTTDKSVSFMSPLHKNTFNRRAAPHEISISTGSEDSKSDRRLIGLQSAPNRLLEGESDSQTSIPII